MAAADVGRLMLKSMDDQIDFSLSHTPIVDASISDEPAAGAVLTFDGRVRNHNVGRAVSALEYQAHGVLACQVGRQILQETFDQYGLLRVRAIHRTGHLAIGDLAVRVTVASAHRQAAFEATRVIMERLKYELPIWKKETYLDGSSEWVGPDALPAATGAPIPAAISPAWGASIHQIWISPENNFRGRHGQAALQNPICAAEEIVCIAGKGLLGDRYFDFKPDYKGQITFFDEAVRLALMNHLNSPELCASLFRRNVLVSGVDLSQWIGRRFSLQGVEFEGSEECAPCYWMDQAIAPGAEAFLKEHCRGGLRARILTDGVLHVNARG